MYRSNKRHNNKTSHRLKIRKFRFRIEQYRLSFKNLNSNAQISLPDLTPQCFYHSQLQVDVWQTMYRKESHVARNGRFSLVGGSGFWVIHKCFMSRDGNTDLSSLLQLHYTTHYTASAAQWPMSPSLFVNTHWCSQSSMDYLESS